MTICLSKRTDRRTIGGVQILSMARATDSFSATGIRDASGASGSFAGHQVEGRVRYWLVPDRLRAEINAALLVKRGLLLDAPTPQSPATLAMCRSR